MIILLSPSKALNFDPIPMLKTPTIPNLLDHSQELIEQLRDLSVYDIQKLMKLSDKLGQLNYTRFQNFSTPFNEGNSKQAIFAFNGNVYDGLDINSFTGQDFISANKQIRILSGLYGLLKPLDLMQPYRLEMGCKFNNSQGKNLYEFWGNIITDELNSAPNSDIIVNLASNEYFKVIKPKKLNGQLINISFKEQKNGQYKIISIFAKRARGMMARYIVQNQIDKIEDLTRFDASGYMFNFELSSQDELVFTR